MGFVLNFSLQNIVWCGIQKFQQYASSASNLFVWLRRNKGRAPVRGVVLRTQRLKKEYAISSDIFISAEYQGVS